MEGLSYNKKPNNEKVNNCDEIQQVETEKMERLGSKEINNQKTIDILEKEKSVQWIPIENPDFNQNNFYRIVEDAGFKDFLETESIRSSPTGTESNNVQIGGAIIDIGHRGTIFPSFDKGQPDFSYLKEGVDNYIFEVTIPMYKRGEINPVTGNQIRGRHWAYRPINQETGETLLEISKSNILNILKLSKDKKYFIMQK